LKPESVTSPEAPAPVGPYSQAIKTGCLVFVSGQLGIDPSTGKLADGVEAQASRSLENVRAVLAASGCGMDRVVKTTILLADMSDFKAVNAVYAGFFTSPFPARATFAVAGLPLGARVEIEAVASIERKDN
jgi:2-iminobutanoate/2-iminopropanoate deaminase